MVRAQARGVSTGAVLGQVHVPGWWRTRGGSTGAVLGQVDAFVVHLQVS